MCTYLDQVGATYYFRRAVPQELQPYLLTANGKPRTEFKISLRTKDRETAKRKLREYAEATDIAFDKARAALARDQAPPAAPLSPTDARRERAELEYDEGLAVFEAQRSAEHDARVEEAEVLEARLKLPSDQLSATERAAALLLRDLEEDRDRYRGRYRRRKLRDAQDAHTAPEKASTAPAQARTPCGAQHGSQGKSDGVSISGLYEKYATQPGIRIRPSTIKQWRAYIENLIDFLGEDSAEGVSPKSLILWREHLRTLPGRGGKPLSPKTINDSYLAAARVTFDYGLNNLLIEANPIAGVQKVRTERKVRLRERDFTNAERKAILRAALAGTSGRVSDHRRLAVRWVPWLCAYTGARVNEITQLRAEDVKQIDGVWTIHITPEAGGVKTDQARTVPIHEHLVAQGFLEVVKSKAGPLFYVATDDGADSDRGQHILVLTDRIDLDDQISKTFVACGLPNPAQCGSVAALREAVNRGGNGQILLSTIFKFAGSKEPIPNSGNWIVLVDECHRTQEQDLGAFLQATLPDAHFYGFTGTPIKSTDKDTYARFSLAGEGYLDKYGIDDAVRDGATVPILYEGRKTDWAINEAEIDVLFDRWFVDLPDDKREELKRKGLTLATIAKHPERIRLIALDIWEHFKAICQPDGFKAQIVVVDREAVVLYRAALAAVIAADLAKGGADEGAAQAQADAMIACAYSKSQEDNKPSEDPRVAAVRTELGRYYLDDAAEKEMKRRFKASGQEPSFLIVCDKLLTGFDAPIEHVMYLDKPLKEHNLLQAIARTNRTCAIKLPGGGEITKPHGRIVDYIGITSHLDEALASYRADDVENALRDIAILRNDLKEAHARYRVQKQAMGLDGMDEKTAAYAVGKLAAEGREDEWFDLQRFARIFVKVYGDLSPDPAILDFTDEAKWAAAFLRLAAQVIAKDESLDHRSYSGKIREMLEQHVHVTGLSTTIRLRNLTDPNFADDFETEEKSEEQLQEAFVRKSTELRRITRELIDRNPAQYGRFSERVLEIIRRFEQGQLAAADGLHAFEDLAGDIDKEQSAHDDLGMDERAFSILRILEDVVPDIDQETLKKAALAVGLAYADAARTQPAFAHMEAYLRSLRQHVRRVLTDLGIGETKAIREKVEEYAVHAYGGSG